MQRISLETVRSVHDHKAETVNFSMNENDVSSSKGRLSVIIPVFNRKEVTLRCLEQLCPRGKRSVEIIVVDDGSRDGTSEAIRTIYPRVHIVQGSGNWWYTRSINEGLKYALQNLDTEFYLLLNNDIDFGDSYMDLVFYNLEKYRDELIVFGSVSFDSDNIHKPVFLGIKKFTPWLNKQYTYSYDEYLKALKEGKELMESIFVPGRGMFFSKNILLTNGLLDESFPQYASDYEFSGRGRISGTKTMICLHTILYSHEKLTGAGSPKNKPSFFQFLSSLFNKYSPTYPINNYKLIRKHINNPLLMPLSFLIVLSGKFKAYFKYKYNLCKH